MLTFTREILVTFQQPIPFRSFQPSVFSTFNCISVTNVPTGQLSSLPPHRPHWLAIGWWFWLVGLGVSIGWLKSQFTDGEDKVRSDSKREVISKADDGWCTLPVDVGFVPSLSADNPPPPPISVAKLSPAKISDGEPREPSVSNIGGEDDREAKKFGPTCPATEFFSLCLESIKLNNVLVLLNKQSLLTVKIFSRFGPLHREMRIPHGLWIMRIIAGVICLCLKCYNICKYRHVWDILPKLNLEDSVFWLGEEK